MTRDEIIRMARESGLEVHDRKQQVRIGLDTLVGSDSTDKLIRFAALVAAAEREACAKVCEKISDEYCESEGRKYAELRTDAETGARDCESAIRARGEKGQP